MCSLTMTVEHTNGKHHHQQQPPNNNNGNAAAEPQQQQTMSGPSSTTKEQQHHGGVQQHHHNRQHSNSNDKKRTWEESFELLKLYRDKYGHCNVPIRYDKDRRLGRWVYSQRSRRDKLTEEQIHRLEALGFEESFDGDDAVLHHPQQHASDDDDESDDDGHDADDEDDHGRRHAQEDAVAAALAAEEERMSYLGRRRKGVKRYGINDNDDESDISRRKKERATDSQNNDSTSQNNNDDDEEDSESEGDRKVIKRKASAKKQQAVLPIPPTPPPTKKAVKVAVPAFAAKPPPVAAAAAEKLQETPSPAKESPDHDDDDDDDEERPRGKPRGRPRGRPRKETMEEKIAQLEVGIRLAVLWPAENQYYRCSVTQIQEGRKRPYFLDYDDGETEWIDLATTDFLVLKDTKTESRKRPRQSRAKSDSASKPQAKALDDSPADPAADVPVGTRVSVYWTDDEQYYEARVVRRRKDQNHPKPLKLEYQDGEYEWVDLEQHRFIVLSDQEVEEEDSEDEEEIIEESEDEEERKLKERRRKKAEAERKRRQRIKAEAEARKLEARRKAEEAARKHEDDHDDESTHVASNVMDDYNESDSDVLEDDSSDDSHGGLAEEATPVRRYRRVIHDTDSEPDSDESDIELVSDVRQVEVGSRVAVYWSDDERYYEGSVTKHREGHPTPFYIEYDDGDTVWLDLKRRNFCILKKTSGKPNNKRGKSKAKAKKKKPKKHHNNHKTVHRRGSGGSAASSVPSVAASSTSNQPAAEDVKPAAPLSAASSCASPPPPCSNNLVGELEVGARIGVFCPVKKAFKNGTVKHCQIPRNRWKKPCYYVDYDEGNHEWIELPRRKIRMLSKDEAAPPAPKTPTHVPAKKKRKRVKLAKQFVVNERGEVEPEESEEDEEDRRKKSRVVQNKLIATKAAAAARSVFVEPEPPAEQAVDDNESVSDAELSDTASEMNLDMDDEGDKDIDPTVDLTALIDIGTRIAVQCPKQRKFLEGTVTRRIWNRRKPFYVEYDVGGFEWIDVHFSIVRILAHELSENGYNSLPVLVKQDSEEEDAPPCHFAKFDGVKQPPPREIVEAPPQFSLQCTGHNKAAQKNGVNGSNLVTTMGGGMSSSVNSRGAARIVESSDNSQVHENDTASHVLENDNSRSGTQRRSHARVIECDDTAHLMMEKVPVPTSIFDLSASLCSKNSFSRVGNSTHEIKRYEEGCVSQNATADNADPSAPVGRRIVSADDSEIEASKQPVAGARIINGNGLPPNSEESRVVPDDDDAKTLSAKPVDSAGGATVDGENAPPANHPKRKRGRPPKKKKVPLATTAPPPLVVVEPAEVKKSIVDATIPEVGDADDKVPKEPIPSAPTVEAKPVVTTATSNSVIADAKPEKVPSNAAAASGSSEVRPKKRGRGRPPKSKKIEPEPTKAGPQEPLQDDGATAPETVVAAASSTVGEKTTRGKSEGTKTGEDIQPKLKGAAAEKHDRTTAPEQVKRGRGRPPRDDGDVPKKRGPGRPRGQAARPAAASTKTAAPSKRHHENENDHSGSGSEIESDAGSTPTKRPRGRPPSHATTPPLKKRGPGRPPRKDREATPSPEDNAYYSRLADQVEVGCRVAVYWGGDDQYYNGTVAKDRLNKKQNFFVEYDDGETEWIDFRVNKFKILHQSARARKKPARFASSEEEDDNNADNSEEEEEEEAYQSTISSNRRGSDSGRENDSGQLIRNRMDMADVMSRVKIGSRVEVFWSDDDCYYSGTITNQRQNFLTAKKPFYLVYDDGESEWIDLRDHVFHLLPSDPAEQGKSKKAAAKRKRDEFDYDE